MLMVRQHTSSSTPSTREVLSKRRQLLAAVYKPSELAHINCTFPADNPEGFLRSVREVHGEGVVAKCLNSKYEAGKRTGQGRKLRINTAQEFAIGGYTHGVEPFDAVLIGFYRDLPLKSSFQISHLWRIYNPQVR